MPTTPNYGLPYPLAGDPANVPLDMQELADRLDVALRVTASLSLPTDQGIPNAALTTINTGPTPVWDTDAMAATAGRLTCKTAGYYLVHCHARWATAAGGTVRNLIVHHNTVRVIDHVLAAGIYADHNVTAVVYMVVGDYVYPSVYHDQGAILALTGPGDAGFRFTAARIG